MPDPGTFDSSFNTMATIVHVGFVVVGVLFVISVIRGIIFAVRRRAILRDAGLSPMMASAQLEAKLASSAALAPAAGPARTVEERLDQLETLHKRGVISSQELSDARAKILTE